MTISKQNFIAYKKGLITNDYTLSTPLGSGSFGTVRKAVHKLTGQPRAIKILKKADQDENKFFLEVEILAKLSHPNIMQIFEFYDDSKNFYIVSEICSGGELFDKISEQGVFTEKETSVIIKQILSAVFYSHKNNIVHRDLKPENILLDDKSENPILKIIDFGGARYFSKNKKMSQISGTPYYIAPEVLNESYDEKCDIWSCGVILYILLCGYPPFNGESDLDIMKAVKVGKYDFPKEEWDCVSEEAKDLIKNMLKYSPKDRYSAEQCLSHKWFKKFEKSGKISALNSNTISNIKKFHHENKLQQATLSYIVNQLITKEEKNQLLAQFQSWDKNGDGVLSRDEIFEGYKALFGELKAKEDIDEIMESMDLDGNGTVDYNEFITATINKSKILSKQNLEATFKAFDKDGSGKISVDEIMGIFNQNTSVEEKKKFEKMINDFDANGDGEISLEEFKTLMSKLF
jgi:calcium-dependent protein kinase